MKKIIRVTCLKLDPITVLADSAEEAHLMVIGQMLDAFGHVPMGSYTAIEWDTGTRKRLEPLRNFAHDGKRGIAYADDHEAGWWFKPLP